MPKRSEYAAHNLGKLIDGFSHYLDVFDEANPFRRSGQYELHAQTLGLRSAAGSAKAAIAKDDFLKSLYDVLQAWGIGRRGSKLVEFDQFCDAIRHQTSAIQALEGRRLDDSGLDVTSVSASAWDIVNGLGIAANNTPIVSGTKALHHILPDLVAPVDRQYTRPFFGWYSSQFQYQQAAAFDEIFRSFRQVALTVNVAAFTGTRWRTARTKLLDNAVVGFCIEHNLRRA